VHLVEVIRIDDVNVGEESDAYGEGRRVTPRKIGGPAFRNGGGAPRKLS